jgi:hypothetical protein
MNRSVISLSLCLAAMATAVAGAGANEFEPPVSESASGLNAEARPHGHRHRHAEGSHQHQRGEQADGHGHHGVETEHLFGFTLGSDIDPPGGRHLILDLSGSFGKRTGSYSAWSTHVEYAFTPWQNFHVSLGASLASHRISGVEGLEDRGQTAFEGLGLELRQRVFDRKYAPFGLTLTAAPHWARLDEKTGESADKFAVEFNLAADKELIKGRLFAAVNLIYEPEWVRIKATGERERESTFGASFAAMMALAPSVFLGGEVRYLRAYEGVSLDTFSGEAWFVGPTLYVSVNDRLSLIAAYSTQASGRAAGGPTGLELENFERHRAKLKAVVNF